MAQIRFAIAWLVFSSVALAQSSSPMKADAVIDTPEFMTWMMKPAYAELQRRMQTPPADRAEWAAIYQSAARLAETANLLFIRRHAGADTPAWAERSAGARQAAADVASAALLGLRNARPSDFATVTQQFSQVSGACNACHKQFGGTNAPTIRD